MFFNYFDDQERGRSLYCVEAICCKTCLRRLVRHLVNPVVLEPLNSFIHFRIVFFFPEVFRKRLWEMLRTIWRSWVYKCSPLVAYQHHIFAFHEHSPEKLSKGSWPAGVFYGGVCIGMAGVASLMGSVLQVNLCRAVFHHDSTTKSSLLNDSSLLQGGSVHIWHDQRAPPGPLPVRHAIPHNKFNGGCKCMHINRAILSQSVTTLTPPTSSVTVPVFTRQGGLTGMIVGLALTLWVGIGGQIYPPLAEKTRPLPLTTVNCSSNVNATEAPWTTPDVRN